MDQCALDLDPVLQPPRRPPADARPLHAAGGQQLLCPITRRLLGGSGDDAAVLEPLGDGSLAVLVSRAASRARAGCTFVAAATQVRHLETGHGQTIGGLALAPWRRWALLLSFATPLADVDAARLPLALLPPPGVQPLHPLQQLQAAITLQLAAPGWSRRLRELADEIGDARQREDFQLFVGALAPRLLELGTDLSPLAQRHALEDLWLDATVRRRWQHVALQLGAAGAKRLLARSSAFGAARQAAQATALVRGVLARAARGRRGGSSLPATPGSPAKNSSLTIGASA